MMAPKPARTRSTVWISIHIIRRSTLTQDDRVHGQMLAQSAERKWRKLNGYQLLGDVIRGVIFKDGINVIAA